MGHAHYLRSSKGNRRPRRMLFVEVASKVIGRSRPYTWHGFDCATICHVIAEPGRPWKERWFDCATEEDFNATIRNRTTVRHSLYVFGFNVGRSLWLARSYCALEGLGFALTFFFNESDRYGLNVRQSKRRIRFYAVENFFPDGFTAVAEHYKIAPPSVSAGLPWARYRTEVAKAGLKDYLTLLDDIDGGSFCATASSQSLKVFTRNYLGHRILVNDKEHITRLERTSYFGGRCEVRRTGKLPDPPYVCLDINSSYPSAMAENVFPTIPTNYLRSLPVSTLKLLIPGQLAIADVCLRTDLPLYPVRHENRVYYPTGEFRTTLCTRSLLEAINRNHLTEVLECVTYKSGKIFERYVGALWRKKEYYEQSSRPLFRSLVKLLMNSLFGKLGQQVPDQVAKTATPGAPMFRRSGICLSSGKEWTETSLMGTTWLEMGKTESGNSIAAIAAHVTDYARWRLWEIVDFLGYDTVLYMDTDSVIITAADLGLLAGALSRGVLGGLEMRDVFQSLYIYGPRDYDTDKGRCMSGVKAEWAEVAIGTFAATGWPTTIGLLDGIPPGRYPEHHFYVVRRRKHYASLVD